MKEDLNRRAKNAIQLATSFLIGREERKEQIKMSQFLLRFLDYARTPGQAVMVEAGTGVGKTFGYLIPICEWFKSQKNIDSPKIVISTDTISLQEQLTQKDIPVIKKIYPKIRFEKAKGRANYTCKRKLYETMAGNLFATNDEEAEIGKIIEWLDSEIGSTGDRSDMDFDINSRTWHSICSDPLDCHGNACEYYKTCYHEQAKKRVQKADVIITTHAMVLTDYAQTRSLPDYNILVLDEAHNFGKNAVKALTVNISRKRVNHLIKKSKNSWCHQGFAKVRNWSKVQEWQNAVSEFSQVFFDTLTDSRVLTPLEGTEGQNLRDSLLMVCPYIEKALENTNISIVKTELANLLGEIIQISEDLKAWLTQAVPDTVYWIEKGEANYVPVNTGYLLKPLWECKTTILTSATLCIAKSFTAIRSALCLNKETTYSLRVDSPFDYKKHALVYVPPTAPSPKTSHYTDYISSTIESILEKTGGKTFVLFTSYAMMQTVSEHVIGTLGDKFTWLVQGNSTREILLAKYKEYTNAVLFGTNSYWEGIDEDVNCVIITKLPFAVPTNPVEEARYEQIKSRGGNPFIMQAIPQCAIKLKQGTGRLIRNQHKKGVIVICDPRIMKPWSKAIIQTLPEMRWTKDISLMKDYLAC
mgnify:CR=1 FL=1